MRIRLRFALLALLTTLGMLPITSGGDLRAQRPAETCVGGRLYYVAFPDTVTNTRDSRFPDTSPESISLMIYSPVAQSVSLSRGRWSKVVALDAGEMASVELTGLGENTPLVTTLNRPDDRVVRVEAATPIILYAFMSTHFGTAGFTPLPVEAWGEEYYAATWPGEIVRNVHPAGETNYDATERKEAPAEIMIVAAYDDTQVSISPTAELHQCNNCTQVTLNRGEAYIVQSLVDLGEEAEDQEDIAGSFIQANRPIGVLSANTRANIRPFAFIMLGANSSKDMTAEWLRPVEQHGTTFAFTPVMDLLRQRDGGDVVRDSEHLRIYPTAEEDTRFFLREGTGSSIELGEMPTDPGNFVEWRIGNLTKAYALTSTAPSQVFQGIPSVAMFNGTTGSGNFIGATYKAWGSAMVEVVPREKWTSFAPWRAPVIPSDVQSWVNLVTDTGSIRKIYRRQGQSARALVVGWEPIPGTDMVWTSMSIDPGTTYLFEGDDGARFGGYGYGMREGYELYRPGGTKDDGKGAGGSAAHPAEYEEEIAGAWALPFASTTCVPGSSGDYIIEVIDIDCDFIILLIYRGDGSPLNLQYLALVADQTQNVRLELIEPDDFSQIDEATQVIVKLALINPARGGKFLLEFRDYVQLGRITQFEHDFSAQATFTTDPSTLEFTDAAGSTEESILLTNRTNRDIDLQSLALAFGDDFQIIRTSPEVPWSDPNRLTTFAPGDTLRVWVRYSPSGQTASGDSLIVDLRCGRMAIPIIGTAEACLVVGDLDFGSLRIGESRTLSLEICNDGAGRVTFEGGDPLSWGLPEFFSVSEADLELLRNTSLGAGDCITINVTFTSQELIGNFRSVARLWGSTRKCRDTSIWVADVGISSVGGSTDLDGYHLHTIAPNPTSGELAIDYAIPTAGLTTITLIDPSGRELRSLLAEKQEAGAHRPVLDLEGLPSGLYFVRIRSGEWDVVEGVFVVK